MKKLNISQELTLILVAIAPLAYLAYVWSGLPETVPVHFNAAGEIDRYGSKMEIFWLVLIMTIFTYGIMAVVQLIDPKQKIHLMGNKYWILRLIIVGFIAVICFVIINSAINESINDLWLFGSFSVMFMALGNYLQTVPPNYFVGVRTPWTLESPEVWKKTHRVSGRMMMMVGLILFLLIFILPPEIYIWAFLGIISLMSVFMVLFSYQTFQAQK